MSVREAPGADSTKCGIEEHGGILGQEEDKEGTNWAEEGGQFSPRRGAEIVKEASTGF